MTTKRLTKGPKHLAWGPSAPSSSAVSSSARVFPLQVDIPRQPTPLPYQMCGIASEGGGGGGGARAEDV
eukprot:2577457-Pyramimonas_sp.AAC.1